MKVSKPVLFTLIGSIIVIIYLFFFAGPKKATVVSKTSQPVEAATTQIQSVSKSQDKRSDEPRKVSSVDVTWKRDPFLLPKLSLGDDEKAYVPLKLVGIIEGSDGRYAILDSHIVKKGDLIGEDMVYEITKDRVILVRKGRKKVIAVADISRMETNKPSLPEEKR